MKILVTGGHGFIGKAFLKKYRNVFDIVAPTHAQMDLNDARAIDAMFSKHKFDVVLHLAGALEKGSSVAENIIMFKNMQYMSIVHGVKKLIVVEVAEFDNRSIVDFTEDMTGLSDSKGGLGLSTSMITLLASKDKITTVLRVFDVYGPGGKSAIDKIVTAAAHGKTITIDRDRTVSAIHIEDLVKTIAGFLKGNIKKGDYNVTSGDKISYIEIAKSLKRRAKRDDVVVDIKIKSPNAAPEYTASNGKLLSVFPTFKPITIKDGVKKMYHDLKA